MEARRGEANRRPNIVIFIADDQGIEHVGCYGNAVVRTANIDRLAAEGMRFTRAYTVTAMCAPSRSALYTGLYPHRNGCQRNHSEVKGDTRSLPHYLRPLGYRVGLAGKGHIGPDEAFPFERLRHRAKDVREFIRREGPFCLVVASHQPHGPHSSKTRYRPDQMPVQPHHVDTPQMRNLMTRYYADIDLLDREVGEVTNLLAAGGLEDDTVFIYSSDHGFSLFAKWSCYEAGLHVPFLVRWPGRVKKGATTDAMVSFVDVVPTLIELAGGKPPRDLDGRSFAKVLAGEARTHRKLIYGTHTNVGIHHGGPYPIRSVRDERYKYIRNLLPGETFKCMVTHTREGKLKADTGLYGSWVEKARTDKRAAARVSRLLRRPAEELYDLAADPFELDNLAAGPACADRLAAMRRQLDAWMKEQGDRGVSPADAEAGGGRTGVAR
jgi:uncharacterized sulfatase